MVSYFEVFIGKTTIYYWCSGFDCPLRSFQLPTRFIPDSLAERVNDHYFRIWDFLSTLQNIRMPPGRFREWNSFRNFSSFSSNTWQWCEEIANNLIIWDKLCWYVTEKPEYHRYIKESNWLHPLAKSARKYSIAMDHSIWFEENPSSEAISYCDRPSR